jgi:hypothetical protein
MRLARVLRPALVLWILAAGPRFLSAQAFSLDLEAGYRFVDVSGNEQMYRSQIDERQGILLRSASFVSGAGNAAFDELRFSASDLGAGPAGFFRLEAGRRGAYRLQIGYRRADFYSALPAFANPLLAQGIIPGQHTMSRVRHVLDLELELLPGAVVTPLLGYTWNRLDGPGRSTYTVGGDEFLLAHDLEDRDQEFRVGAAFHAGTWAGQIVQGWRKYKSTQTFDLFPGAGEGNNLPPVLGVPVEVDHITRRVRTDADTPVTSAFVTGRVGDRVRVVATYGRARADGDTSEREDLTGSLVSFAISRFFGGLSETASTRAKLTQWRGSGRVEYSLMDGMDLAAGYERRHRELDGVALVSTLFLDTTTFAGFDPRDVLELLDARTAIERTEDVFFGEIAARSLGPLALRAGFTRTEQDVTVTPDPSEIVVPGGQGGDFERAVNAFDAGATFTRFGLTFGADARLERADDAIVRTDFRDRDRFRLRAGWTGWAPLSVTATAEWIDASNDRTGFDYDLETRQYAAEVGVTPWKPLHLRFSAGRFQTDTRIPIRRPQDFGIEPSIHSEEGDFFEAGAGVTFSRFGVDGAYGRFDNDGSFSFTVDRWRLRASADFTANVGLAAEWARDDYEESLAALTRGDYEANRFGIFLRWRQ